MKLSCGVYGDGRVFSVDVEQDADVETLRTLIAGILGTAAHVVSPINLTLYLARTQDGTETKWLKDDQHVRRFLGQAVSALYDELRPLWSLEDYFGATFVPEPQDIHVLVHIPQPHERMMPAVDEGWTAEWLREFRRNEIAAHRLPPVGALASFLQGDLPVRITVHERIQDTWIRSLKTPSTELLASIFAVSNAEPCVDFLCQIGHRVVHAVDPGDSKTSFISFWDDLIRHVLNFVLPDVGKSDRSTSGTQRPDFMFLVDSVCVFRGEERDPGETIETARRALLEKIVWCYGDVPYLFGYVAVGYEVRLYAITDGPGTVQLGDYNLEDLEGRFRLLLAILNLARLLRSLASLCPDTARGEYRKLVQERGVMILLEPSRVVKCYPVGCFSEVIRHVQVVYKVLQDHAVPNVDRFVHAHSSSQRIVFEPRGDEARPTDLVQLFCALKQVLEALVKLHAASWMHRDIRWPNVIKRRDGSSSWFLIDFMDAAISPQPPITVQQLSRSEHAPELFGDCMHTTAVDMWSVGRLIQTCGDEVFEHWYDMGRERSQFLELLMHEDPSKRPTAVAAYDRLCELEQAYLNHTKEQERY